MLPADEIGPADGVEPDVCLRFGPADHILPILLIELDDLLNCSGRQLDGVRAPEEGWK